MKAFLAFYMTLALVSAIAQVPEGGRAKQVPPPAFVVTDFDNPSDGYYQGYLLLKVAEQFKDPEELSARLRNALATFREVTKRFPNWKRELLAARIIDVEARLKKVRIPEGNGPPQNAEQLVPPNGP
jgi:hypothetical protein